MKIFTIENGQVTEGAIVRAFHLKGADVAISAILVGEEGRGRHLGVLPVELLPDSYKSWEEDLRVEIQYAEVGQTKSGKPKLFQTIEPGSLDEIICVFRTQIGFRGSNNHTGDCIEDKEYQPFPGEWLVIGRIAQGIAGRMGCGEQGVAILPKDTVFRTAYRGRLYGKPSEHFYIWDGKKLLSATRQERQVADIF